MASIIRLVKNILLVVLLILFVLVYAPLLVQEATFKMRPSEYYTLSDGPQNEILNVNPDKILKPTDTDFGIVIPKINANASIIKDINASNHAEYQQALSKGIAQALGSALPNQAGSMFLFSHAGGNFWQSSRYNSIFYLLNKLQPEDKVYVYFKAQKYTYAVTKTSIVNPSEVDFDFKAYPPNSLVLMTAWPPGTTFKRVVVEAQKQPTGKK